MKKALKILGGFIFIITLILGGFYLYLTDFGRKWILSNEPRNPKIEIPVIYNLPWLSSYQEKLIIENLKVNIVESKLNIFNRKSLISYTVKGKIKYDKHWKPYIKKVHISERINKDSTQNINRIIELTPILNVEKDESENGGIEKFEFKNEHTITSGKYGFNTIKIICGNKETIIKLRQRK
jgi:hypothetical protein